MGVVFRKKPDVACHKVVFPEDVPDDCCNYDRRAEPGVPHHGYVPLSH